jgi:hypothetical protein
MPRWIWFTAGAIVLVFIIAGPYLRYITTYIGLENVLTVWRARRVIRRIIRKRLPGARVHSSGETHLSPGNLCICIDVTSDEERESLRNDAALLASMRKALFKAHYPEDAIPDVCFRVESQETVTRDFNGNWKAARN